jgi:molecular chaperone DnaK
MAKAGQAMIDIAVANNKNIKAAWALDDRDQSLAEARANEATDKIAREKVEKFNAADALIFQTEKQIKEYGDKIPADKKSVIEGALAKLKEAHKSQDLASVEAGTQALNDAWQAASQDMYNASQQGADGQPGTQQESAAAGGEGVTDAEFEEVK